MKKYHKIQSIYKRDQNIKTKPIIEGSFSIPEIEYLKDNEWVFDEKIDGTNIRVIFDGNNITFGGKTDNAQIPSKLLNRLNERFLTKLDLFKEVFQPSVDENSCVIQPQVCFYCEGFGKGIQKGGCYRPDQDIILFDIKIGNWWLKREDVISIAEKFGLEIVPIIGKGTLYDMVEMTRKGFKSQWGNFIAEGIVARPSVELKSRNGQRIITKIKHKDFK